MPDSARKPLVRARRLVKQFKSRGFFRQGEVATALDGVDLDVYTGEILALIGESGSGKTTLGKVVMRLTPIDNGTVEFDGQDLFKLSPKSLLKARRSFQMVFQNQTANLHPKMTIMEMMDESLKLHQPTLSEAERLAASQHLLERVGLGSRGHQRPGSMSGGEKRRAGLARILATKPKLIVADEPTSGLDAAIKLQIIELLKGLQDSDTAYLLISHDLGLVRRIADRVVVMLKGRIVEMVPTELLGEAEFSHPYTRKLIRATVLDPERRLPPRERRNPPRVEPVSQREARAACVFATDCSLGERLGILDQCRSKRPELVSIGENHRVACFGANHGGGDATDDN